MPKPVNPKPPAGTVISVDKPLTVADVLGERHAGVLPAPAVIAEGETERLPEGWVKLARLAIESGKVSYEELEEMTGIKVGTWRVRSNKEKWQTPGKVLAKAKRDANELIEGLSPHLDLREYEMTPKKFRPQRGDILSEVTDEDEASPDDVIAALEAIRSDSKDVLARKAEIHQLAVAHATETSMAALLAKIKKDPMIGVLFAKEFECLDRTARRNYRLDENKDPTAGARTIVLMSQPGMIPKPAISKVVDAEEVAEDEDDGAPDLPASLICEVGTTHTDP